MPLLPSSLLLTCPLRRTSPPPKDPTKLPAAIQQAYAGTEVLGSQPELDLITDKALKDVLQEFSLSQDTGKVTEAAEEFTLPT